MKLKNLLENIDQNTVANIYKKRNSFYMASKPKHILVETSKRTLNKKVLYFGFNEYKEFVIVINERGWYK